MKLSLEMEQFLLLALHHLVDGNTGPARNDIGYVLGIYLFLYEGFLALHYLELFLNLGILLFLGLHLGIADFCHFGIIAFALGAVGLEVELLDVYLVLLYAVYKVFLSLPFGGVLFLFLAHGGKVALYFLHLLGVALALYGLALYLLLGNAAGDFVESLRQRINLKAQFGRSLIHKVNGLVGKKTIGDITFGKLHGSDNSLVAYAHLMVILVALLEAAQNGYGAHLVGLVDHHLLETAFERFVLLKVFLILVERGGAYTAELAARQGRLEDIGGIHGSFAFARAHKGVYFVNK